MPTSSNHEQAAPLGRHFIHGLAFTLMGICTGGMLFLQARASLYLLEGSSRLVPTLGLAAVGGYGIGAILALAHGAPSKPAPSPRSAQLRALRAPLLLLSIAVGLAFILPCMAHSGMPASQLELVLPSAAGLTGLLLALGIGASERAHSLSRARMALFLTAALVAVAVGAWLIPELSQEKIGIRSGSAAFVAAGLVAPALLLFTWKAGPWVRPIAFGVWLLISGQTMTQSFRFLDRFYEALSPHEKLPAPQRFARIVENSQGVLTLHPQGILRQNGIYQGTTNLSPHPKLDLNRSRRAYLLPSVVDSPKNVLLLGLGSGAWAQIFAHHPDIESVTVLENNPAFLFLAKNSGAVASIFKNPQVKVRVGNVERLLAEAGSFDVIVQDQIAFRSPPPTRYLTVDHLKNLREHLTKNGAVYVNTHEIPEAEKAVLEVFPHALKYQDMLFGSLVTLGIRGYHWMDRLADFKIDGRHVLPQAEAHALAHDIVMNRSWKTGFAWQKNDELRQRLAPIPAWSTSDLERPWLSGP